MSFTSELTTDGAGTEDGGGAGTGGGDYTPDITLDWDFFPFMGELTDAVGGFQAFALVMMTLSLIASAIVWAIGHWADLGHRGTQAKIGLIVIFVASALIGGAAELIGFSADMGSRM